MKRIDVMVGAFTPFSTQISTEAKEVFQKAMNGLLGVNYTPLAVSTQVVEGTNYRFFCNAKVVYPNANNDAAMVEIYQPLNGEPHIRQIHRC